MSIDVYKRQTKVWLNKNTTLKYPHEFAGKGRKVYLEGEGYFEVMRNLAKPFVVQSEAMQVRVLGTVFNLKSDKATKSAVATLLKGEVEVKGNHGEGMIILAPEMCIRDRIQAGAGFVASGRSFSPLYQLDVKCA